MRLQTVIPNKNFLNKLTGVFSVVCFLSGWHLLSTSNWISNTLFPSPLQVFQAAIVWFSSGDFGRDIFSSLARGTAGFSGGALLGIVAGLITGRIRIANQILYPLLQIFRPLPPVAIIPLIIVWFGIGDAAKVISIMFAVFFPVWINVYLGARNIPQSHLWSASLLTRSKAKIFINILLPSTLPSIVAGCRTAIATAFIMIYVSELAGASEGLGYRISINHLAYKIDYMMGALAVLAAAGALADFVFMRAMIFFFPWLPLMSTRQ